RGGTQIQPLRIAPRQLEFLPQAKHAGRRSPVERRKRDVLEDRQADDDALMAALFRDIDDARADGVGGRAGRDDLTVQRDGTAAGARDAEYRLHQFAAAGPDQTIEAEYLALAQFEGDAVELGRVRQVRDGQDRRSD